MKYVFRRTQTVTVRMAEEGEIEDFDGEPVHWDTPTAQLESAREWRDQAFPNDDYCEDFMEAETSDWEQLEP